MLCLPIMSVNTAPCPNFPGLHCISSSVSHLDYFDYWKCGFYLFAFIDNTVVSFLALTYLNTSLITSIGLVPRNELLGSKEMSFKVLDTDHSLVSGRVLKSTSSLRCQGVLAFLSSHCRKGWAWLS